MHIARINDTSAQSTSAQLSARLPMGMYSKRQKADRSSYEDRGLLCLCLLLVRRRFRR
jgi:hypothetical protein